MIPPRQEIHYGERIRASAGALLGLLLTAIVSYWAMGDAAGAVVAPIGASAVLLFALPSGPLSQPWSIVGGNTISALVGVTCFTLLGATPFAAAAAVCLALMAMFALRCVHPPGGAVALSAVIGGAAVHAKGFGFVLAPVALNSVLLLALAWAYNNATRKPYPHRHRHNPHPHATADQPESERLGFTRADLDAVLRQYNEVLNVDPDDLDRLFRQTEMQAYRRRFGEITCGDIMSRDVVSVEYGTLLEDAWRLLRRHDIKALPVVDRARRVIGIITMEDFIRHAQLDRPQDMKHRVHDFVRRQFLTHTEKPEVAGQIMSTHVKTAGVDMHIVELVPLLSVAGVHHVPVVDHEHRLAGIVTQSDLVAALYRGRVTDAAVALAL